MSDDLFAAVVSHTDARGQTDDAALLRAMLRVESALAEAQGTAGDLTGEQVEAVIVACAAAVGVDIAALARDTALGGNPVIPLVAELRRLAGQHADAVHRGATSQDVLDSAIVLMARDALGTIGKDLDRAASAAVSLAGGHTQVAGRTLMQQAVPLFWDAKVGVWRAGLEDVAEKTRRVAAALPVQLGGPVGDGSTFGERYLDIRADLADRLGLTDAACWHTVRLPVAELASVLATASGVVAKIAGDVVLLAQSEVGEVREVSAGRGGSSSMPHKNNPIAAVSARASARRAPHLAAHLFAQMEQEQERAAGAWHAEWSVLVDLVRATGSAAWWIAESLASLEVDADAMGRHR